MKVSVITTIVASAALVAAQLDQIPPCALSCAVSSIGASGCSATDIACVCKATSFLTSITSCVEKACSAAEYAKTLEAAKGLCLQAGVTLVLPGASSTSSVAAPSTSAPAVTTSAVSTSTATVVVPTSSTTAVYVPSSASSKSTKTMTMYTTICSSATTVVPTVVPPTSYIAPNATTSYAAPPAYTGAAGNVVANAGTVILGAALAMFFA